VQLIDSVGKFTYRVKKDTATNRYPQTIKVSIEGYDQYVRVRPVPLWLSILPPLLAIVLALIFREVIISIFLGVFLGAATIAFYASGGSLWGIGQGFLDVTSHYIINALTPVGDGGGPDTGHASVIVFTLLIGGLVAIISRNGGMQGVVNIIARMARTARSGQFATWLMGIAIFFDDYANSLVVGNTMRPITDKLRISREKLAYIVDSTAAPVAALAFITTWIGAELGYISKATEQIAGFPADQSAYGIFLNSLTYSFYPILALIFILILIWTGRDFGPMLGAERRARLGGQVSRDLNPTEESQTGGEDLSPLPGAPTRAFNAVIPILVLIAGVIAGLLFTGWDQSVWDDPNEGFFQKLSHIIGDSDSYKALLWASVSAIIVAVFLTIIQGIMGLRTAINTMSTGFKAMLPALIILVLAWALAQITQDMGTATYLAGLIGEDPSINFVKMMPALTFLLAAAVAFSTGSSWGTMAILYPIILSLVWKLGMDAGMNPDSIMPIFYNAVSAVLAGSVFGDHCSPISDTTILSSLATDCNHVDHVRTQLPYAIVVGIVATFVGTIPAAFGWPWYLTFPLSLALLIGIVLALGKKIPGQKKLLAETNNEPETGNQEL
jgi:Na+/H+ antiporter NhaC